MIRQNKSFIRIITFTLLFAMLSCLLPAGRQETAAETATLQNPRTAADGIATWDCVWFGHYPQTSNGKGGFNNDPIKWRVLSVNGDKVFLLADKVLDAGEYNQTKDEITWEYSTIRSWLNGYGSDANNDGISYAKHGFMDAAFSEKEKLAISDVELENEDNPDYDTNGGHTTIDKIFLLSITEAINPRYGFLEYYDDMEQRESINTAYASVKTDVAIGHREFWWLRTPGDFVDYAAVIEPNGAIGSGGIEVYAPYVGIRPALYMALTSSMWSYAGTVTSDGIIKEIGRNKVLSKLKRVDGVKSRSGTNKFTISWKYNAEATGYQVLYATNSKFNKGKKVVTIPGNKNVRKTIKNLKPKTTYYVKVRAYRQSGKSKLYGNYSNILKVKVK